MKIRQRVAAFAVATVVLGGGVTLFTATEASAHGTPQKPGSRTWLCWQDGIDSNGAINPINPACASAVAISGPNSLYNWFSVLRSDAGGKTTGYIADGQLCSGGNDGKVGAYNFLGYDQMRTDWPVTHLTSGANYNFEYSNWAHHPGTFYFYVTRDGFDPTQPLKWSDLESTPFLTVTNPPNQGGPGTIDGHYYWTGTLPANKSGRHIIYSRWVRSDSNENFFACSDVVFDGGNGNVTGVKDPTGGNNGGGTTTTTTKATTTTTTTTPATSTTTTRPTTTTSTTTTEGTSRATTTTTTSNNSGGGSGCTATYKIVGQWQGGFQAEVSVKNNGTSTLNTWTAGWTYADGQKVTSGWSANFSGSGSAVTATNVAYNGNLGAGQSTSFGFLGSWSGNNSVPTVSCNGVTPGGGTTTTTTTTRGITTTTTVIDTTKPTTTTTTTTTTKPTTTTTTSGGGNGSLLNDGFEGQTGSTPGQGWVTGAKDCTGTGTASIDSSVAHSGSKSLKITGGEGYCNHIFVQAPVTPSSSGDTYVRAYIRHTTALPTAHVTFIAMNDANDGNRDLRIGGMNSALMWNRLSDDAALPAQSPVGISYSRPLGTGSWQCFEFKVSANGTAQTWVNGTEVPGLTVDGTPTPDIDQQWIARSWHPAITNIRFGWESYGQGADTLWYDDVAVGSSRIGC